MHKRNS